MPTYRITDPQTGAVLRVTGESPPTEQELDQLFTSQRPAMPSPDRLQRTANAVEDGITNLAIGAAKGVGNTVFGLGKIVRDYTPIGRLSDAIQPGAFAQRPPELVPRGGMQQAGFLGEQMAEFAIPVGAAGRVAKAAEVGKSALLTKAQTGSTGQAGLAAGLSVGVPLAMQGAAAVAPMVRDSAEKTIAQALGATKEAMKAEAARLAPQILDRGISGTRAGMLAQAKAQTQALGQLIANEVATKAASGATVDGLQVRGAVQLAADALRVADASGRKIPIAGTEGAIKALDELDDFVGALGPDIPFEKAQRVKQIWQHIVSKAGLYGPKAQATATDAAAASALREGASVFKEMLASGSPELGALNREFAFWKGLRTVLTATTARTQSQTNGLVHSIGTSTGAVAGSMLGGAAGAGIGAAVTPVAIAAIRSPWFKTTAAAPLKNALATALASGEIAQVRGAVARITAAMPAGLRAATAQ